LREISDFLELGGESSWNFIARPYQRLSYVIRKCRNRTDIHHRFLESQLDYILESGNPAILKAYWIPALRFATAGMTI